MKKRLLYLGILFVILIIGFEIILLSKESKIVYPDISSQLENVSIAGDTSDVISFTDVSIKGKNYSELICQIKKGKARIISLKTDDDILQIPSSLGKYPVKVIGGDWTELPEAVEFAKNNQRTPKLGVYSWMNKEEQKYKKIIIEEGICTIYAESFYGIRTEYLEFPESILMLGAVSFAKSDVDVVNCKSANVTSEWGAFLNTPHQKQFRPTSPENIKESLFAEPEHGETHKPL